MKQTLSKYYVVFIYLFQEMNKKFKYFLFGTNMNDGTEGRRKLNDTTPSDTNQEERRRTEG